VFQISHLKIYDSQPHKAVYVDCGQLVL